MPRIRTPNKSRRDTNVGFPPITDASEVVSFVEWVMKALGGSWREHSRSSCLRALYS